MSKVKKKKDLPPEVVPILDGDDYKKYWRDPHPDEKLHSHEESKRKVIAAIKSWNLPK